jgi:hypothetical protein
MHMIWHHFHFDQARLGFVAHMLDQSLQTDYRRHENRAPVLRAEHHTVLHEDSTFRFDLNSAKGFYIVYYCIATKGRSTHS